jgi:hypothetical protein
MALYSVQCDPGDGYPVHLFDRLWVPNSESAATIRGDWLFRSLSEARAYARRQTLWGFHTAVVLSTSGRVTGEYGEG